MTNRSSVDHFPPKRLFILKIITISSSSLSIVAVSLVLLWFVRSKSITRKKFRYYLLLTLLQFDLLKAIFLMSYPIHQLYHNASDDEKSSRFCNVVGFFVALTVEGADFAVLHLAIHTAVIIFGKPFNQYNFLYRVRWYASVVLIVIIPFTLAGLGFVGGYCDWTTMCYLPVFPVRYRLGLSWIPRCTIILIICTVYLAIYIRVKNQIKGLAISLAHSLPCAGADSVASSVPSDQGQLFDFLSTDGYIKILKKLQIWASQFPGLAFVSPYKIEVAAVEDISNNRQFSNGTDNNLDGIETRQGSSTNRFSNLYTLPPIVPEIILRNQQQSTTFHQSEQIQRFIQTENYHRFQNQRALIEQQLSVMFVYPVAYVIIWIFPLIEECLNYRFLSSEPDCFWVIAVSRWMISFGGFVDSAIFYSKELLLLSKQRTASDNQSNFGADNQSVQFSLAASFNRDQREQFVRPSFVASVPQLRPVDSLLNLPFNLTRWSQSVPRVIETSEISPLDTRPPHLIGRKDRKISTTTREGIFEDDKSMDFVEFLNSSYHL